MIWRPKPCILLNFKGGINLSFPQNVKYFIYYSGRGENAVSGASTWPFSQTTPNISDYTFRNWKNDHKVVFWTNCETDLGKHFT